MTVSDQDHPQRMVAIQRVTADRRDTCNDQVATEEPLEIRIVTGPADQRRSRSLAITMRTPGADPELALGFLRSENIIQSAADVISVEHVGPPPDGVALRDAGAHGNTLMVELATSIDFHPERLQRHFYLTSSCGICGKASLEAIQAQQFAPVRDSDTIARQVILELPERLRQRQAVFDRTGGLHAAALFDMEGQFLGLREDVGRHNAVDKLVGWRMYQEGNRFAEPNRILMVSGRASFELVQKAIGSAIGTLVAVGAPSSLAVELAREFGITLIGFASARRFNLYAHAEKVVS